MTAAEITECFGTGQADIRAYSPLALAFLGDAVYEMIIRTIVLARGNRPAHALNRLAVHYVSARSQACIADILEPMLDEEELSVYHKGKNAKPANSSKYASLAEYHKATGLETLCGSLYLQGKNARLLALLSQALTAWETSDGE